MLKRIRVALLAIALFLGSLAAAGALKVTTIGEESSGSPLVLAQSAGPGEVWHAYVIVQQDVETQALYEAEQTFQEQPECNQTLQVMGIVFSMSGVQVITGFCSTQTSEQVIEEIKKNQGDPA